MGPQWRDQDDEEIIYFYEFPTHELQIEQSLDESIQRIFVTKQAVMADAENRKAYGVNKSWPPY